ncbi:MAG: GNAT family N-acetyltransferase [Christensenellales bacterium]
MRKMLEWLPMQYMLDTLSENPNLAKYYEGEKACAVLFGHSLFIGGAYDRETALYLAKNMRAEDGTIVYCPDEAWLDGLREICDDAKVYRRAMLAVKPYPHDGRNDAIMRIDTGALEKYGNAEMFTEEVLGTGTYLSMADFFARGIGFAPVYDGALRGFCTSEYPSRGKCAIGIYVDEAYRGRGLAADLTRAFLNTAHEMGMDTVYWECWANNAPSIQTALKCGFEKQAEYEVLVI